jgi:pinin/SDK/memA/ protein conserved region
VDLSPCQQRDQSQRESANFTLTHLHRISLCVLCLVQKDTALAMFAPAHNGGAPESMSSHASSSSSNERKRPRILSTIGATNSASHDPSDSAVPEARNLENEVYKKPEAIQRNKRIFGALMGHLGIAKRKLEEDSSHIDKQTSLQMTVLNKNGMENRRLQQLQREATDAQKAKVRLIAPKITVVFFF